MKTDQELLREFVSSHAEPAFAELVRRHIGVVYAAACRENNGNTAIAQDVTQLVFIELVRKAPTLLKHPTLAGWLYSSVRFVSANARRAESRRLKREEAHTMNELLQSTPTDPHWEELKPVLDDAMHELNEDDRNVVLLRFFEGRSLREVGHSLSISENTARMRVERALEKLQKLLAQRGVHSTHAVLTKTLAAGTVAVSPAILSAVTSSAYATATVALAGTSTFFGITTMGKIYWVGISALVIAAASVTTWEERQRRHVIAENALLRDQVRQASSLRETNEALLAQVAATEEIRQSELRELMRFRAQASVKGGRSTASATSAKEDDGWRERFEGTFSLRDGEALRRMGKPFGPEREEYYRRSPNRGSADAPDYYVFRADADGKMGAGPLRGWCGGDPSLSLVLRHVAGLGQDKFHGTDELLNVKVPGDWIKREGVSMEAVIAALEPIVQEASGRNIRFEKQSSEINAVVVRGHLALERGAKIDIFAEQKKGAGGDSGDFSKFLKQLGDRLAIPFVNEASLQNTNQFQWSYNAGAGFNRGSDQAGMIEKVLENLSKQTGLQFEVERRACEVWFVTE